MNLNPSTIMSITFIPFSESNNYPALFDLESDTTDDRCAFELKQYKARLENQGGQAGPSPHDGGQDFGVIGL